MVRGFPDGYMGHQDTVTLAKEDVEKLHKSWV